MSDSFSVAQAFKDEDLAMMIRRMARRLEIAHLPDKQDGNKKMAAQAIQLLVKYDLQGSILRRNPRGLRGE